MAGEDIKRRSHRRKHHAGSTIGRTRTKSKSHKDDKGGTTPAPATVEDLRKARLDYLERPLKERQFRMKYVYETPAPKLGASDRDRRKKSTTSLDRRKPKDVKRRRKSAVKERRQSESEGDFVYDRPVEDIEETARKTASKGKSRVGIAPKATAKTSGGKKATEYRSAPNRRHTEPVRPVSPCDQEGSTVVDDLVTNPPRRQSTIVLEPLRPSLKRSATIADAKTQVSLARSNTTSTAKRKDSGILSNLFVARGPPPEQKISCLTCGDDDIAITRSAKLPCKHRMCHSCLKRVFKMSITDPAHMPPRCCKEEHIDLKHVDKLFDQSFKKTWNRRFLEYKTKNRVYCIGKNCGEWIKPNHITTEHGRKVAKCKRCGTKVCPTCNNKAHTSRDCPKDPATKQFIETAKLKGWQRCYSCSAMVELKEGCNHMTCRCTAEFCMVCGLKWKSCDCPWFNYENVDQHLGNPVRYQQEIDRRRDQEHRDEALARRMQALGVDGNDAGQEMFGIGNAAGHHMNQNFIQQAREALTANYQNAEQAARDLLNGWVTGRENRLPDFPGTAADTPQMLRQPSQRRRGTGVARRGTNGRRNVFDDVLAGGRSQTTEERDQERRIQAWANSVAAGER